MHATYRFESLEHIANWCAIRAEEKRRSANGAHCGKVKARELIAEASAYESLADMLRNVVLEGVKCLKGD